jgi:hypothetical protein
MSTNNSTPPSSDSISSSDEFLTILGARRKEKLLDWRNRYTKEEYAEKVAKNLLYEGLAIGKIWNELLMSFSTIGNQGEPLFSDISSAQNHIFVRRRQISVNDILPTIEENYPRISHLPTINFNVFRGKVDSASRGNVTMIEEVEFTYYYYTAAYEMIYLWASFGLMGLSKDQASLNVSGAVFPVIDYSSPDELVSAFAQMASNYYSQLPKYL